MIGKTAYEERYQGSGYYWGTQPSGFALKVLQHMPAGKNTRLLDVGCGEGRNAVFFARNGFDVTAFDLAESGIRKTKAMAKQAGVSMDVFQADVTEFEPTGKYDVIFAHGVLHYLPLEVRGHILGSYRNHTRKGGIDALSVFVHKPFIPKAPDGDATAQHWRSGELFTHYHDWKLELCTEEIFDCNSSGIPHRHAINKMIARKV